MHLPLLISLPLALTFVFVPAYCLPQIRTAVDSIRALQVDAIRSNLSESTLSDIQTDVADEYWSAGLSPNANVKRFKAIRAGLLLNLNESVQDLTIAIKSGDAKDVQYHLRKMSEKWNRVESLQKTIIQLIPDDNLEVLVEEARLFEDNRDVVDRQRELATEFLLKTAQITENKKESGVLKSREEILEDSEITTILTTSVERDELPNDEAIALEKQRKVLALEMTQLSEAIDAAIEENNESEKRTLVDRFRFEIWPQITRMSLEFFQNNPSRREHDVSIQNWLREQMATILYKAGARYCESPDETYFQDLCVPYGSTGTPCHNDNLQLYDMPDNQGICDCKSVDSSQPNNGLFYSNVTGNCHVQNSRAHCAEDEWLIIRDNNPVCELIPAGCNSTEDGRFVFWSPNPVETPESCVALGSEHPCGVLQRQGFALVCAPPLLQAVSSFPILKAPLEPQPCLEGSFRHQAGLCQAL